MAADTALKEVYELLVRSPLVSMSETAEGWLMTAGHRDHLERISVLFLPREGPRDTLGLAPGPEVTGPCG